LHENIDKVIGGQGDKGRGDKARRRGEGAKGRRGEGAKGRRGEGATRRQGEGRLGDKARGEERWVTRRTLHFWGTSPPTPLLKKARGDYTPGIFMNGLISYLFSNFTVLLLFTILYLLFTIHYSLFVIHFSLSNTSS
jgi:hypothetical protein